MYGAFRVKCCAVNGLGAVNGYQKVGRKWSASWINSAFLCLAYIWLTTDLVWIISCSVRGNGLIICDTWKCRYVVRDHQNILRCELVKSSVYTIYCQVCGGLRYIVTIWNMGKDHIPLDGWAESERQCGYSLEQAKDLPSWLLQLLMTPKWVFHLVISAMYTILRHLSRPCLQAGQM